MKEPAPLVFWQRLTSMAVLGTARAPLPDLPSDLPERLSQELETALVAEPERRLLRLAAVLSPYVRAGARGPIMTQTVENAAPDDALAPCSGRSATHLEAILFGPYPDLLDEWSSAAAHAGIRAREELLVPLLDHLAGSARGQGVDCITEPLAVLGARGKWLAARNETWRIVVAAATAPKEAWRTGSRQERSVALLQMRRSDAAAAREELANGFADEAPDDREIFIRVLGTGLSIADEPFLESALDDRRKAVRLAAAELLYRLPEARLSARMAARARELFRATGQKLEVSLPEECDTAMARDGVDAKRYPHLGEKARLLAQIVGATPLAAWSAEPTQIVEALLQTDFADALLLGLSLAAGRQADPAFCHVVLRKIVDLSAELLEPYSGVFPDLLGALSDEAYRALGEQLAAEHALSPAFALFLLSSERPFDPPLSLRVLAALRLRARRGMPAIEWQLQSAFKGTLARRLHPSVHAQALQDWPMDAEGWTHRDTALVETLATTLAFRCEMLEELKEKTS